MIKQYPNTLLCRVVKEGFGFKEECLSPDFRLIGDNLIQCSGCGNISSRFELQHANNMRRNNNEEEVEKETIKACEARISNWWELEWDEI